MIGQTAEVAPADKRIYALRDVTATVESVPLIVASILSKKLAEGIDALVLDVKVGKGAFMKDLEQARTLASALVRVGTRAGKRVVALLTRMEAPLGRTIGNALETREAIDVLFERAPADMTECTYALCAEMLLLADAASDLFAEIRREYAARGITETPFLVMKADAGTYGMGVMVVKDPVELRELSRRDRNKMARVKEGLEVTQVIVQEGVPTFERVDGAAAEPVVYFIDHYVVGGFYRVHTERGPDDNLNAPGMHFTPLTFARPCSVPDFTAAPDAEPNRFYAYGVVARLALAAATREIESLNESHSDVAATPLATAR